MIDFLDNWIEKIAITAIVVSIFEMMLPDGNVKKYVKLILGIYIVFNIISPFIYNKTINNFDFSKVMNKYTEDAKIYNKGESSTYNINKVYKDTFEKDLIKTIEKEGFNVYKCEVKGNFDIEDNNAEINKIVIILESQKEIKNNNEKNKSKKLIENVNNIEKVEINIKTKNKVEKNKDVSIEDLDNLKSKISNHYEINKEIIDIHIR